MKDIVKASSELHLKLRDAFPTLNIFFDPSKNDDNVWFDVMWTKTVNQHEMVTSFLIAVRSVDPHVVVYDLYLTEPSVLGPDDMFLDVDKLIAHVAGLVPHD